MIKNVLKSIIFMFLLYIFVCGISHYFSHKKVVGKVSVMGISGEKVNSIDYIVLGDSETYTSIIPLEIWDKYGYTGYVLGTPAQKLKETKDLLLDSLTNQKPKLLILETNMIFRKKKATDPKDSVGPTFTNLFKYHDNWKYLVNENFGVYSGNDKGYAFNVKVKKGENENYKQPSDERAKIPEDNVSYIEDIIEICKENDIEIMLLSVPSLKNWNYKRYNSLSDLAKKYNLNLVDLNIDDNVVIDWNTDTKDAGDHLNYYGAKKVTSRLGEYLSDLNLLEDHREDDYYNYWNISYDKYLLKTNNR